MNKLFYLLIVLTLCSCANSSKTEKYQDERDHVIDVRDKVKEIEIKNVMISHIAFTSIIDDYLIIVDYESSAELLHIFDKNTFKYISSRVFKGRGPGEILNFGYIATDEATKAFYITDHGKHNIFRYDLDSLLADSRYMPTATMKMKERLFPRDYQYINDTLSIGLAWKVDRGDFETFVAKWNMNTAEIKFMKYQHPDIKKKRIFCAVSMENDIYVECYNYHDLMTICSLKGDLKYNIYGRDWNSRVTNKVKYFGNVSFYKDKIVVLYSGEDRIFLEENNKIGVNYPAQFMVFDLNGDYIKTLEMGVQVSGFSLDKENNRFILELQNDMIQFAYLDLDGLID